MKAKKTNLKKISKKNITPKVTKPNLFKDIKGIIETTKKQVALNVNSHLVILNWQIGKRILNEILKNKRAGYGEQIVATLSQQLMETYGQGYTKTTLNRMLVFAKYYVTNQKVATLSQQFSWSHVVELLTIKDPIERSSSCISSKKI